MVLVLLRLTICRRIVHGLGTLEMAIGCSVVASYRLWEPLGRAVEP